jgi:enoyl-CoA hydratase/carnithine racemase
MAELQTAVEQGVSSVSPEMREGEPASNATDIRPDFLKTYSYFPAVNKPVIAAVNGPAAGLGLILTLYCDIRFASEKARFTTAFARRGLIAEYGLAWILPRIVGLPNALDLLFSARFIDAREALGMGLVQRIFPEESLLEGVIAYASELAGSVSPRSLKVIKKQVWDAQFHTLAEAYDVADREMLSSIESEDFREGVAHFVEKRPPAFTGK